MPDYFSDSDILDYMNKIFLAGLRFVTIVLTISDHSELSLPSDVNSSCHTTSGDVALPGSADCVTKSKEVYYE